MSRPRQMTKKVSELQGRRVEELGLSEPVEQALKDVQAELAEAYRDSFSQLVGAVQEQASALRRIQETLSVLVRHLAPTVADQVPAAFRVAGDGESPDLATALVVADPIGQGFTLSQTMLAKTLGVRGSTLGIFIKAMKLDELPECAVVVRTGKHNRVVNYHPRAVERFRRIVLEASAGSLEGNARSALLRLKRDLENGP